MARYYYTDVFEAAYMHKSFNIQYKSDDFKLYDWATEVRMPLDKYYIHPDCHEMLKPRFNDLVKVIRKHKAGKKQYIGFLQGISGMAYSINGKLIDRSEIFHEEILQRNTKAWFMPEVEGD